MRRGHRSKLQQAPAPNDGNVYRVFLFAGKVYLLDESYPSAEEEGGVEKVRASTWKGWSEDDLLSPSSMLPFSNPDDGDGGGHQSEEEDLEWEDESFYGVSSFPSSDEKASEYHLPFPPEGSYKESECTIGGVGKTLRWKYVDCQREVLKRNEEKVNLVVALEQESSYSHVRRILSDLKECWLEAEREAWEEEGEGGETMRLVRVIVYKPSNVCRVAYLLHREGISCDVEREEQSSKDTIGIERLDRMSKEGPRRDVERWKFDFVPSSWRVPPFSWERLCRNLEGEEAAHFPLPLSHHLLDYQIGIATSLLSVLRPELETSRSYAERSSIRLLVRSWEEKRSSLLSKRDSYPLLFQKVSSSKLSFSQVRQLLACHHCSLRRGDIELEERVVRALKMRYLLDGGYFVRRFGQYDHSAKHLGHGSSLRNFPSMPQYDRQSLSIEVLNRIYKEDGSLRGIGYKGTRGKHSHPDHQMYVPKKKAKRSEQSEQMMLCPSH